MFDIALCPFASLKPQKKGSQGGGNPEERCSNQQQRSNGATGPLNGGPAVEAFGLERLERTKGLLLSAFSSLHFQAQLASPLLGVVCGLTTPSAQLPTARCVEIDVS